MSTPAGSGAPQHFIGTPTGARGAEASADASVPWSVRGKGPRHGLASLLPLDGGAAAELLLEAQLEAAALSVSDPFASCGGNKELPIDYSPTRCGTSGASSTEEEEQDDDDDEIVEEFLGGAGEALGEEQAGRDDDEIDFALALPPKWRGNANSAARDGSSLIFDEDIEL